MDLNRAFETGVRALHPRQMAHAVPPQLCVSEDEIGLTQRAIGERADSHVLLPVFPVAIRDLLDAGKGSPYPFGARLHYKGSWWYDEPSLAEISREPLEGRWMLLNRHPILYDAASAERCIYAEAELLNERRLSAREALHALIACELMATLTVERENPLFLPDRDYVVLGFEDRWRPGPYTIWNTGHGYLLSTLVGKPLDMPYYGLTEYVAAEELYTHCR